MYLTCWEKILYGSLMFLQACTCLRLALNCSRLTVQGYLNGGQLWKKRYLPLDQRASIL